MKEKLNQYKYFIIALLIVTAVAAGFYTYQSKKAIIEEDNIQFNFSIDGRNYIMPSPFHSFHFLNNMNFQWKGLAGYNSTSEYPSESQTALNLGFRAADGIVMLFADEKENARKTRIIVIELADRLEITPAIREAVADLDNAVVLHKERDVLDEKIIRLQYQMEKALHKKKKDNLAVLVELGGWLEGLHIASKGIVDNYNPSLAEILRQPHIAEIYIDVLMALSHRASSDREKKLLDSVLEHLIKIYKIANHSHKEAFPLDKVKELYSISEEVKKIIETSDIPEK